MEMSWKALVHPGRAVALAFVGILIVFGRADKFRDHVFVMGRSRTCTPEGLPPIELALRKI